MEVKAGQERKKMKEGYVQVRRLVKKTITSVVDCKEDKRLGTGESRN